MTGRRRRRLRTALLLFVLLGPLAGLVTAAEIGGTAVDSSGGALIATRVTLRNLATGDERVVDTDASGRYRFDGLAPGFYRVSVALEGFSEDARVVGIANADETHVVDFVLYPGGLTAEVTVTATRSERDALLVPLRTDTIARERIEARAPRSTGDVLIDAPGITPVGSGPYELRPRLRGLDSTRVLILVDGERLNTARVATDRAGTEVGLIDLASVDSLEVVSGRGSVLYGTDALSGTINIITNQPRLTEALRADYGFDGFFSSNETGRRGSVHVGVSGPRAAFGVRGTIEAYDDYVAGADGAEDTRPLFAQGRLRQADTIDDAFGFAFGAFPDPFNAPFVRTSSDIPRSSARGSSLNAAGVVALSDRQTLRVKFIRRRVEDIGFPDFEPPAFFQTITLPSSGLDRISAQYEARSLTPWFTNLQVSAYYQDQDRVLRNRFPVQFPVPSPRFFPIDVLRLQILSDTRQHVMTPGVDVQGTFLAGRRHVVTAGVTVYRDRSEDSRVTVTQPTLVGRVGLGPRGPQAFVLPSPVPLGPPTTSMPVRVPDSSFRDIGIFVQDEWEVSPLLRLVGGLRVDGYRVTTDPTPGYDVQTLVRGAQPPIPPAALPDVNGERIVRTAFTGDVGVVVRPSDRVSVLAHYGRSYRHPNLEELLFSGPATVGAIVPNTQVGPERGDNYDVGLKLRSGLLAGSLAYFHNRYDGFISTEIVASTPGGPLSQAINFADTRIQGVEGAIEVPLTLRPGVVTLFGNAAFTHGQVLSGTNPLTGDSLSDTPLDNITPFKAVSGVRFTDLRDRYWIEYGNRTQSEVTRIAPTLLDSPFLIAQDLLSLEGFSLHRLAWGVNWLGDGHRAGLSFAIENLTDRFYREQFQFAPARGRSFTIGLHVRAR